jgi:uncharacterized protein (UPF0333 family)
MVNIIVKPKKAQLSLEFSFLFLAILLASIITINYFLSQNFSKDDKVICDVENAAKTAVILANSGYNGINPNVTLIYGGISWSEDKKNIYIYISPKSYITPEIENFIINYTYNVTKINQSVYNITINPSTT